MVIYGRMELKKHILTKHYKILFVIFIALWNSGCIDLPTDLKAPQWDVDLNVPIVSRSYTLNDIIKQQNYISISGSSSADSIYIIQSEKYAQSINIADFVKATTETSLTGNLIPVSSLIDTSIAIYLPIPDGAVLNKAVFSSGTLKFHVINPASVTANITITFPGIIKDNSALKITMYALPGDNGAVQYSLAGYNYSLPQNQQSVNQNKIQMIVGASMPNGPLLSFLDMDFYCSDFYFSSVTGYLPARDLGTKTNSFVINLGKAEDYRDKVSLKSSNLNLNINCISQNQNPFGFELTNVNIIGEREDGSKIYLLDSTGSRNFTIKINNGSYYYQFTQNNSNLNSFISFLPSKVTLNADYIMNPDGATGTVAVTDSIKFTTDFSTSSALAFESSMIADTVSVNITDQDSIKIKDAKTAYINVDAQNGIPLNTTLDVTLLDRQYKTLFTLKNSNSVKQTIAIDPAAVNSNGEVINAANSNLVIQLDSTQTKMLSAARYVAYSAYVYTNTSNNNPVSGAKYVTIRPNNTLKLNVYGGVKYHVNTDDLK